jgi:PAS domain S-box-containing protein
METGEAVYDVRHAVERPDGQRILLSISGAPLFDAAGQVERVVFTFEDVTQRVQAEQALRRSEEKYRNLFEYANDAILVIDFESHRILDANEKAAQRLGYTPQALLQLTLEDIEAPMDSERRQAIWQELSDNGSVVFEHVHQRQDGTTIPVEVSSWVTEYENRSVSISLARDISERVRAENARQKEMHALELLSGAPQAGVTAASFGLLPLRQSLPDTFKQMVARYQNLLELALERRIYKIEQDPSEDLREAAEQLGLLRAGPRDVVEIHMTALKQKVSGLNALKAQAYADEGRLIVLELMGYLASYYRNRCTGSAHQTSGAHRNKGGHRE